MIVSAQLSERTLTPARKLLSSFYIYGFLICTAITLLYPVIFTREASFCVKVDNLHQTYPFFNKLAIALHKGYLPVWDGNTFGGKNFAGEIQTGIFYPVNIIWCLLFGTLHGMDVYYIDLLTAAHFVICLLGMYKLARTFVLPPLPAIVATLIFTFTGAVSARAGGQTGIFFGLTLLPWSVYFIGKYYLSQHRKRYLILAGLMAGMEILAGHMQPFFHTMIINGILILYYEYKGRRTWRSFSINGLINLLIILLVVFVITLPQMYYAAQYLSQCYRNVGEGVFAGPGQKVPLQIYTHQFVINFYNLPNLLGQEFTTPEDDNVLYMGILPLFLLVTYLVCRKFLQLSKVHADVTCFLLIILAVGAISALGYLTPFPLILYHLPYVPVIRQLGRYIILVSFSASLLIGLAVDYILQIKVQLFQRYAILKQSILLILSFNALYWIIAQQRYIAMEVSIPFLLCFLFLLALRHIKRSMDICWLVIVVLFVDINLNKISFDSTKTEFYPNAFYGRNRIIDSLEGTYGKYRVASDMQDFAYERRNLGDIYNIQTSFGYGATYNKRYLDFRIVDGRPNSEIGDLLNIRYVLTDKVLDSGFVFKDSVQGIRLYEKANYYPRMYWKSQIGMRGAAIEAANNGLLRWTAYNDTYQRIEVNCALNDTLILAENYYPGWKCYDKGKEIPIHPVVIKNYPPLFRGIALEKGIHSVEFRYNKVFYWF